MSTVIPKSQMTEEDIKLNFITPAITAKWSTSHITMETKITDGRINLQGNKVSRDKPKNLDQCGYPHEEEEILAPMDLIQRYEEQRASLNAEIDSVLAEITALLGGGKYEQ